MYVLALPHPYLSGLGDQQSAQLGVQLGATAASGAVGAAAAAGLISATAVPVIGAAVAGVALLVTDLVKNSGCGQTCIETSQWANQAEAALQQNINAYFALPAPRAKSNQDLALQTFDQIWAALTGPNNCGNPAMGDAGVRCITDRERGACKWRSTVNVTAYPGAVPVGECWNWFLGYRDPIANDPDVVPDSTLLPAATTAVLQQTTAGVLQAVGIPANYTLPVLIGLGVLLVYLVVK
jgi:hypothetical protein